MMFRRLFAAVRTAVLSIALSGGIAHAAAKAAPTGKVDLNTASVEQLTTLPGVGAKLAARIVEYRDHSGGFKSTQELLNVKGIGEKSFSKLEPHISVGKASASKPAPAKAASSR
jgi:competence protein ComEA